VISFRQLGTTIDCTMRDLSDIGACLMVTSPTGIPNEFELVPDRDKVPRHCRVVWRAANRIGVAFANQRHALVSDHGLAPNATAASLRTAHTSPPSLRMST